MVYAADPPALEPGRDSPVFDSLGRRRRHGGQTPKKRRAGPKTTNDDSPKGENTRRRSGSHGPPIPAKIAPGKARAADSKDMRVFTRAGCPRLTDIVGKETEVWSGRRCIRVRVAVTPATSKFYRVRLDDDACMVSTAEHP